MEQLHFPEHTEHEPEPFNETRWSDRLLVDEYEKYSDILVKTPESDELILDEGGRIAKRIVNNSEWHWLYHILLRHHTGDIPLEVISDQHKLNEFIANLQGRTAN